MKVLRRLVLVAALSFVGLSMIPRAVLAGRGNNQGQDNNSQGWSGDSPAAPELDPSLVIVGLGVAGGFLALMLERRRRTKQ